MKFFLRLLKWLALVLVLAVAGLTGYALMMYDQKFEAPLPEIYASTDSAVIAHGEYLFYGPAHCTECHITRNDWDQFSAGLKVPPRGGFEFVMPFGKCYSKNLTTDPETGLGKVSDQLIARALRYGVKHDGTLLLPFMEYQNMSDEDLTALVSFLKSTEPVKNPVPENSWNLMGKFILAYLIKPAAPVETPPRSLKKDTTTVYGKYLADEISNCKGCHSPRSNTTGAYIGEPYSGGTPMESASSNPNLKLTPPNLTTDPDFGKLSGWNEEQFIQRFRQGLLIKESVMPWISFQQYSNDDLKAIYRYLVSLPPVNHDPGPLMVNLADL